MRSEFIDPGRFRSLLILEAVSPVSDGIGGHAETWAEIGTAMALIEPVRVESRFGADQTLETVSHSVTLRHRAELASGMRFRLGARKLDIVTVYDPDETGRYLVCRVRETGR